LASAEAKVDGCRPAHFASGHCWMTRLLASMILMDTP
jgi:hypothetical protein